MRKIAALILAPVVMVAGMGFGSSPATAAPGESPANPVVVASPSDVPAGAVEDNPSTYNTPAACDTTRSWVSTKPATDEVSHQEYQYKRDVPAVTEISHNEWTAEQRSRTKTTVDDYKTQYHFAKFTRTKTRTYIPGTPEVKAQHYSLAGGSWNSNATPAFPNPGAPFKWVANTKSEPHGNEATYPADSTGQHYTGAPGHTNWFYFQKAVPAKPGTYSDWSAWSTWTKWTPETHTSWEDSPTPLGVPQFHGQGTYSDGTQWYREWQAQFDGQTRQVKVGSHTEYSAWSAWTAYGNNPYLSDPTLPANSDVREYRKSGPVKVIDRAAVPGYTEYYTGGTPSRNAADAAWVRDTAIQGWTRFAERKVVDHAATPEVKTYYAWTDGKVCDVVTPPPTPTPTPPVVTPPTPQPPKDKVKPSVKIRANCAGDVAYVANNKRSNVEVPFKYLNDGKVKTFSVKAGKKKVITEKAANNSVVWIKTKGDVAKTVVPGNCFVPHAGLRK